MSKRAPAAIKNMRTVIDPVYGSVGGWYVFEGDNPGNGYHTSHEDHIRRGNVRAYSILHPYDRVGSTSQADAACALDITANRADMIAMTRRVHDAVKAKDPRLIGHLAEFGGTLNGTTVTAMDVDDQRYIVFDRSHLTHLHLGIHRRDADNVEVCRGIAEVVAGIPLEPEQEVIDVNWPNCLPFAEGTRLVVATASGLKARTAPLVDPSTELRRDGKLVTVAQNYPVRIEACAFVDGIWWIRGGTYWYALTRADGSLYWKKS